MDRRYLLPVIFISFVLVCAFIPGSGLAGGIEYAEAGDEAFKARKFDSAIRLYALAVDAGDLSRQRLCEVYKIRGLLRIFVPKNLDILPLPAPGRSWRYEKHI